MTLFYYYNKYHFQNRIHNLHYEKFQDGTVKCIEDEIPFEVPEGWGWARLQSITSILTDGTHKTPQYSDAGYIFLSSKNVTSGKIDWDNNMYIPEVLHRELYTRLAPKAGDILLAKNGTTGVAAIVDREEVFDIYVSLALIRIVDNSVNPLYVLRAIESSFIQDYFNSSLKGIGVPNLHLEHIRKTLMPIPPYTEQDRIILRVDTFLPLVEQIATDEAELHYLISKTKAKVLDLAIRGKLVPQDPNDEPASVLLECIRIEKEELIKQGKIKRDKKESVIFKGDDNSYYEKIGDKISEYAGEDIPLGWSIASFSQANMFSSETIDPSHFPEEMFELYSVPNFELGVPEVIKGQEIGSSKQSICENDVLVCKINPRINRVWITGHSTSYRILGSSEWIVFRNAYLHAPYMQFYFSSSYFRELLLSNVSGVGGSLMRAQPESVKKYPVLIPPYKEQVRIADKILELFMKLDDIGAVK